MMGIHKTSYKTENGKTRKVKQSAKLPDKSGADKNGAPNGSGANNNSKQKE
jgi:ABC-type proline/glycine betaine transport system substrate-binding protein